jgi:hypothetical protein
MVFYFNCPIERLLSKTPYRNKPVQFTLYPEVFGHIFSEHFECAAVVPDLHPGLVRLMIIILQLGLAVS